jgi:type II secretory pathway pseudopilin PulG
MNSKKIKNAFTLIELLVWIAIIWILLLSASKINFNRLSIKQELDIFTNNVKSNFENIRNNSLSWKWIWTWTELIIPEKWKIEYSDYNSWTIINSTFSWSVRTSLDIAPKFKTGYSISKIRCLQLNWTEDYVFPASTWTWEIEFIWSNIFLKWDCSTSTSKILELTIKNRSETKILLINTLNWLIETK